MLNGRKVKTRLIWEFWTLSSRTWKLYIFVGWQEEWRGRGEYNAHFCATICVLKINVFINQITPNSSSQLHSYSLCRIKARLLALCSLCDFNQFVKPFIPHMNNPFDVTGQMCPLKQPAVLHWAEQGKLTPSDEPLGTKTVRTCYAESVAQLCQSDLCKSLRRFSCTVPRCL